MGIDETELTALMRKGRSQGFLKCAEIIKFLPIEITEEECINIILDMINDMGIEVRK